MGAEVKEASKHSRKKNFNTLSNLGTLTLEEENNFKVAARLSDWQALLVSSSKKRAKDKLKFLKVSHKRESHMLANDLFVTNSVTHLTCCRKISIN